MTASLSNTSTKETLVSAGIPGPLTKSPTLGIPLFPLYKKSMSPWLADFIVYVAVIGLGVPPPVIATVPEE